MGREKLGVLLCVVMAVAACPVPPINGRLEVGDAGVTSSSSLFSSSSSSSSASVSAGTSSGAASSSAAAVSAGSSAASAGNSSSLSGSTVSTQGASSATVGTSGTSGMSGGASALSTGAWPGSGACSPQVSTFAVEPSPHVASCSQLSFSTNPPTSGPHYGTWAAFKRYFGPVPRGFYVHAMEHGAVVFLYNCPEGCAAEVDALEAHLAARDADPLCTAPLRNRFIITADPLLDTRFAAAAWGAHWKSDCMELASISAFVDAHYARAPENFCSDGTDVLDPGSGIPANCGQP